MRALIAAFAAWLMLALPALAEIEIQEVVSPGGVRAWLVEEHSIPFTALDIRFRGGTSQDAPGARGAVNLMAALLEEGSGDMDARAFTRAVEELAAGFGFDASDDSASVSARFLTENRDQAVGLLRQALHQPRFDPDAIERVRAQIISGLRSDATDPNAIAGRTVAAMTYGDHPYGSDGRGTVDSVATLTRDDIVAAHRGVFARDRIHVAAVGDITAQDLGALLDRLLGDLPQTGAPLPGPAEVRIDGGVTVVDFDTPQSVAIFAQPGMTRDDPDFFAAYIVNQILGGGSFESRLMTEVREKRGLTYGVYSYLLPKEWAAVYMGSVASANARIAEAVSVIGAEWARMAAEGPTEKELQDAKTYLTGAYPLRFDGNSRIASILVSMQLDGLPIDYVTTRNPRIEAVTLEDARRVARALLQPEKLHFVVVGRPEGLEGTGTN